MNGEGNVWEQARRLAVLDLEETVNDVCFLLRNSKIVDYGEDMAELLALKMVDVVAFERGGEWRDRAKAIVGGYIEKQSAERQRRMYKPEPGEKTPAMLHFEAMAKAEGDKREALLNAGRKGADVAALKQAIARAGLSQEELDAVLNGTNNAV